MDLSTRYLGLTLAHPFMMGASPLATRVDAVRQLEDGGASAIVLNSLFEEQVTMEARGEIGEGYAFSTDGYLEHIHRLKQAVRVPVIASLNGTTREEWMRIATRIEQAGADALEINIYDVISDPDRSAMSVETELRSLVLDLKRTLRIPVAMKLSPYFTALGNLARRLDEAAVDGLVLFNRFYQPDIDLPTLTIAPRLELSTSSELRVRLQWTALLRGRVRASLALTGGVATPEDGVKAVLAGADAVQLVSAVLQHGAAYFAVMREGLEQFMTQQEFDSVTRMKGVGSFMDTEDPATFQRANYIRTLQSWFAARVP